MIKFVRTFTPEQTINKQFVRTFTPDQTINKQFVRKAILALVALMMTKVTLRTRMRQKWKTNNLGMLCTLKTLMVLMI